VPVKTTTKPTTTNTPVIIQTLQKPPTLSQRIAGTNMRSTLKIEKKKKMKTAPMHLPTELDFLNPFHRQNDAVPILLSA
jgi:hypothetical protein